MTMMMAPRLKLRERRRSSLLLFALASASSPSQAPPSPASRPRYRVAVVGGGVIGLSTALRLAEAGDKEQGGGGGGGGGGARASELSVSVFARGFGPDTTSSGAGGLWEPYKLGDTPSELVNRWSAETLALLLALARERSEGGGGEGEENASSSAGVIEGPVLQYWTRPAPEDPSWAAVAPGFRRMSRGELEAAAAVAARGAEANRRRTAAAAAAAAEGEGAAAAAEAEAAPLLLPSFALEAPEIVDGWTFWSAAAQPSRYLAWLAGRAERAGVELVTRELGSLDELLVFDDGGGKEGAAASASAPAAAASAPAAASSAAVAAAGEGGGRAASSLPRFDAIVNCAGLAGGDLSRDDATPPTPVRGQVARLRPPPPPPSPPSPLSSSSSSSSDDDDDDKKKDKGPPVPPPPPLGGAAGLFLDEETYLIRNVDFVVAGGTGQAGDADAAPRAADRASILARTRLLDPELVAARADGEGSTDDGRQPRRQQRRQQQNEEAAAAAAAAVEDWAGLRPLRSPVRLEARWVGASESREREKEEDGKKSGEKSSLGPRAPAGGPASSTRAAVLVVSNYGHGGSGFTLHWGCAGDAAALVLEGLKGQNRKS